MDQYGVEYMKVVFALITTILILAIILVNVMFLWRQHPHARQFFQVRYCVRIGMAVSNLIIALFSMLLDVVRLLDDSLDCKLFRIALSYQLHYCPIVFGLAFALLSVELILRSSYKSFSEWKWNKSFLTNLAFSTLPWLLGLLIASPLSLSKVEWEDECYYESLRHTRITLLVCMITPVTVAVISCCFIFCFLPLDTKPKKKIYKQNLDAPEPKQKDLISIETNSKPSASYTYNPNAYTPAVPITQQFQSVHRGFLESPRDAESESESTEQCALRNEARMLLLSSVVLFVTVTPLPFFSLGYVFDYYDPHKIERDTENIISNVLYAFFLCTHSLFVPLVWLSFIRH